MKFSFFGIAIALWVLAAGAQMIHEVPVTSDHESWSSFPNLRTQKWSTDRRPHADFCQFDNAFRCSAVAQCLPEEAKCDGVTDCPDGTDESVVTCACLPHEFFCNNTCIDQILLCDTRADCTDNSDEQNCEAYVCPSSHFKCDNHFCVPTETVCNFVDDCGDNSDERNCVFRRCWYGEYQCDNRECVSRYSVCDGKEDCFDGSDEKLCDSNAHFAVCGDGSKAHISVWCDGWPDCPDNHADELHCRNCTRGEFRCQNTRCIPLSMVCDMVCDCAGTCDDELNCEHRYTIRNGIRLCNHKGTIACPKGERCIADDFVCDGRNDCFYGDEGSEENGCGFSKDQCAKINNTFWCSEGRCLPKSVRCNHRRDCLNAEDEENCEFPSCENNEFRCDNGFCIGPRKRCNAVYDCSDKSDETGCEEHVCSDVERKCASGQCIPREWWCDYRKDCPDGSDENDCSEYVRECRDDEYRCNNGQCITGELRCYFSGKERQGCVDNSHLKGCSSWECRHDQMKCADSYCVDRRLMCDGKLDCLYTWTDEEGCPFRCSSEENCSCVDITINCSYLGLKDLPQYIEPEISRMILKGNRFGLTLEPDMFQGQATMQYLDLSDNGIKYIPPGTFRSLWRLRILHLSDNQIAVLETTTFVGLPNLGKINLKGNRIRIIHSLAFNGLSSLKSLDLSHQGLENIFMNAFVGLRSLSALDLSHNSLSHIEDRTFSGLSNLVFLDLSNNRISLMESRIFLGLSSLRYLSTDEFRFCCLARHVERCLPHADEFSSCEDLMSNIVLRICVWVLGVVALTGNVLVILWRVKCRLANKVHSFLITNLAVGDLLMGTYLIIIASVDYQYRGVYFIYDSAWRKSRLCRVTGFLSTLSSELSVFTLTVITLDRFLRISFPLQMRNLTWKQTQLIMTSLWFICILLAGLPLLELDYFAEFYGRSGVCLALHITPHPHKGWEYSVFVFLALNFISFTIIAAAYIWMFVVARQTQSAVRNKDTRKNSRMAQRMMVIVLTDFCCWMPIILLGILSLNGVFIPSQVFAWVAVFVLPLNAAVNPLLYTISTIQLFRRRSKRSLIDRLSFKFNKKQKILSLVPCNHSESVKSVT